MAPVPLRGRFPPERIALTHITIGKNPSGKVEWNMPLYKPPVIPRLRQDKHKAGDTLHAGHLESESSGTGKRLRSIELRHLRTFVAAAEHGSFRKAASTLGIQESAVSRRMRSLEDRIGVSLFHRQSSGVRLTLAGQRFLPRARSILRRVSDGVEDVGFIGRAEDGRVRVGVFSSLASGFLAALLRAYDRAHADVSIELIDGNPSEHVAAIRQLQIDVAFVTGTREWPGCDTIQLWCERVFVVLPDNHALAGKRELTWMDLAREKFIVSEAAPGQEIQDYLIQRLADLGQHPEIQCQAVGRDNLLALVAAGLGLTITSEATTATQVPGVHYRPIAGETLPFSAVWSPENDNPALRRLLSVARKLSRDLARTRGAPS